MSNALVSQVKGLLDAHLQKLALTLPDQVQPGDLIRLDLGPALPSVDVEAAVSSIVDGAFFTRAVTFPPVASTGTGGTGTGTGTGTGAAGGTGTDLLGTLLEETGTTTAPVGDGSITDTAAPSGLVGALKLSLPGVAHLSFPVTPKVTVTGTLDGGGDLLLPDDLDPIATGIAGLTSAVAVRPPIVELNQSTDPFTTVNLTVKVSLSVSLPAGTPTGPDPDAATTVTSDERTITASVRVLALRIPRVLALFNHNYFATSSQRVQDDGRCLVLVPAEASPLGSVQAVTDALGALVSQASNLAKLGKLAKTTAAAAMFLPFLDTAAQLTQVLAHLAAQASLPHPPVFRKAEVIPELGSIPLGGGEMAHDKFGSLLMIGDPSPVDVRADFYNKPNLDPGEGRFQLRIPPTCVVLIPNLVNGNPPDTLPPGYSDPYTPPKEPTGGAATFNNRISSLRFANHPVETP